MGKEKSSYRLKRVVAKFATTETICTLTISYLYECNKNRGKNG